ncbi:hypothetical protein HC928_09715 [bacterium]|nr:hypothetical protein [bacterium]
MGWILKDFECSDCGAEFEELVGEDTDVVCPSCGSASVRQCLSAPKPAAYSMMSKDAQAKCLRKRSREHTLKQLKKDPTQVTMSRHVRKAKAK